MNLFHQIEAYTPCNPQEEADQALILKHLKTSPDIFSRTNLTAHMTASAWVVNPQRTQVLMVYHKLYNSWSWLGGHADGETDLLSTAVREVQEESGIKDLRPVSEEIYSLEILTVAGHEKKGIYVPSHLHLNVTYLLEADDTQPLKIKEDENTGVAWFGIQEAVAASTEPWFQERIYKKLNAKLTAKPTVI